MKVLLVAHAWPDEALGGTELHVRALARELLRRGHRVTAVAGSLRRAERSREGSPAGADPGCETTEVEPGLRLYRLLRRDLYFDHWHKSLEPDVAARLRALVRAERPDVVHVHHWLRLSRDLVLAAAREGVPAVVSLHDAFVSCPLVFRVRPDTLRACDAATGPHPCVACAARVPPHTPWVEQGEGWVRLAERQAALQLELELARGLAVPSAAHRAALATHLGLPLEATVIPPAWRAGPLPPPPAPLPPPGPGRPLVLACWSGGAPHKGRARLVAAVRSLASDGRAVELRLAGGGPPPERIAKAGDAGDPVRDLGPLEPGSLAAHPVARAHAMVVPSLAPESYGLVHDEALELALPAVLPDRGAWRERAGRGVRFFDPDADGDLRRALEALQAPGELERLRAEALAARAAVPSIEYAAARTLELYARALERGAAPAEALPEERWFEARLARFALDQWDAALAACDAEALGLP